VAQSDLHQNMVEIAFVAESGRRASTRNGTFVTAVLWKEEATVAGSTANIYTTGCIQQPVVWQPISVGWKPA
jgi:hypothetical protein